MSSFDRKEQILSYISERKSCRINELAEQFAISRVTVHRILNELETEALVTKVRGGVKFSVSSSMNIAGNRMVANIKEKSEIAQKATAYINEGDAIFLDSSTTCYYLAKELCAQPRLELTVITNSPMVLYQLNQMTHIHVICTGGELHYPLNALAGPLTIGAIERLQFDKAFISAAGIELTAGIMSAQAYIVELRRALIETAAEVTLLMDSSKFSKHAPLVIAPVEKLTRIISDSGLSAEEIRRFKDRGIEIVI
jgi:DeoR family fructose operon transcriptional repressor